MAGYLAIDDARSGDARRAGVLLSHEGGGFDDNVRSRADRRAWQSMIQLFQERLNPA